MDKLLEKYNDYVRLIGCKAEYKFDDGTVIEAYYSEGGFAHLIGLHKLKDLQLIQLWQDPQVKTVNVREIIRRIKAGTFSEAEIKKSKFFPSIKTRYENFSYDNLTSLNYTDAIIDFDACRINSKIRSNYILFEEKPTGEYNHMGIVFNPNVGIKYIETFFHEPTDKYIKGQTVVRVKAFRIFDPVGNLIVEDVF